MKFKYYNIKTQFGQPVDPFSWVWLDHCIGTWVSWHNHYLDQLSTLYLKVLWSLFTTLLRAVPILNKHTVYYTYEATCFFSLVLSTEVLGGSPGLVVFGVYSRSRDCGFESQDRILDGHFSHNCKCCNNQNEAGIDPFLKMAWTT